MNRYLKYLCILLVFPLFFSGCAPEPAPVNTGSVPLQGFELFEAMGISEDLISRSRRDALTGSEDRFTEYSLYDSQHRLVLRVNGDNQIIYVLHEINKPPLDTAVELSPEEAEELAAEQMEAEIYLPFARETFILPQAMADAEIADTELVFYNRQKAYLVTYELVNAWDLSAFQNNHSPSSEDSLTYGIWISAKDGTVLADGSVSEFFDALTAFFYL